jgi:hypothetical protein
MPNVFYYPVSYPAWWLDYYYLATWALSLLFLGGVWAIFFRFGKFSYGIDLGCFWKSALLVVCTTISLGGPMYYNTRFVGEHGQDGDSVRLADGKVVYSDRNGNLRQLAIGDITTIYQESVTYNPPPKIFIVAKTAQGKDSLFVTTNLPNYRQFIEELSKQSGVKATVR